MLIEVRYLLSKTPLVDEALLMAVYGPRAPISAVVALSF